jgi:hypothetical protein
MSRIGDFADDDAASWVKRSPDIGIAMAGFTNAVYHANRLPMRTRELAARFASDHTALRDDEDFWVRCNQEFDPELLTDLALSCAMWLGMGRMLRTLDIGQSCRITL